MTLHSWPNHLRISAHKVLLSVAGASCLYQRRWNLSHSEWRNGTDSAGLGPPSGTRQESTVWGEMQKAARAHTHCRWTTSHVRWTALHQNQETKKKSGAVIPAIIFACNPEQNETTDCDSTSHKIQMYQTLVKSGLAAMLLAEMISLPDVICNRSRTTKCTSLKLKLILS